jgi:hypothetical protein
VAQRLPGGVGSGPEQRKLALETALADVSALKAA